MATPAAKSFIWARSTGIDACRITDIRNGPLRVGSGRRGVRALFAADGTGTSWHVANRSSTKFLTAKRIGEQCGVKRGVLSKTGVYKRPENNHLQGVFDS